MRSVSSSLGLYALTFGILLAGCASYAPPVHASGWGVLGSRTVGDAPDRDVISGLEDGVFVGVRLCVRRGPIHLKRAVVVFGNGGRQAVNVGRVVRAGTCTRTLDLRGRARRIDRVVLTYEAVRDRGRQPVVVVQGLRP